MPAGRPTEYKPEYCQLLIEHMESGLSFESFAGVVKVGRATIYRWVDEYEEFRDAKSVAQSVGLLVWDKMFTAKTRGMPDARGIDKACLIFKMKTLGWREADEEKSQDVTVNLSYNLDDADD